MVESSSSTAAHEQPIRRSGMFSRLVAINPFYLLSVTFVIHGSGLWFRSSGSHEPWSLLALLGGFKLLLAITGILVVRLGKVWDDARSIFVLLLLLTLEISLSFDDAFLQQTGGGWLIPIAGWLFTALLYESVFRGIRMRLRMTLRVPFHIMIGLLFLYPLVVLPAIQASDSVTIKWQLAAYSLCVATAILTLLPAVRANSRCVEAHGTAWRWPALPWVPFGVLIACLIVRSYAICIALDPAFSVSVDVARQFGSIFSGVFLVPPMLAIGILLMQASMASSNRCLWQTAAAIPFVAVGLAVLPLAPSLLQHEFRGMLTDTIASPLYLTMVCGAIYFVIAMVLKQRGAEWGVSIFAAGLMFTSQSQNSFVAPVVSILPVAILGCFHAVTGLKRRNGWQVLFGVLCLVAFSFESLSQVTGTTLALVIQAHVLLAAAIVVGVAFDRQDILRLAAGALTVLPLAAIQFGSDIVSHQHRQFYMVACLGVSSAFAYRHRMFLWPAATTGIILGTTLGQKLWHQVRQIDGWQGLAFYVAGLLWLGIGVLVSRWKAIRIKQLGESQDTA